jgi:hypothetical protein
VLHVATEAVLVDGHVGLEWGERRGPDTLHVLTRISLGVALAVFHVFVLIIQTSGFAQRAHANNFA